MTPDQTPATPESPDHDEHDEMHDDMDECIEACLQAHVVCTMTAQYCLAQGGEHAAVDHVGLMLDCAEISQTSANFMIRGSPYHTLTCHACAELCRSCAESCRDLGEDEHMQSCAEICDRCADLCEKMAGAAAEDGDEG